MRLYASTLLVVIATSAALTRAAAADEEFSVVINGRTGETVLRNDGNSTVNLDGYLLRSPAADVFNPLGWSQLATNPATPGWSASPAASDRLGEANLFGSTPVGAGETLSIGSPYIPFVPSAIGEEEPGLDTIDFTYSVAGSGSFVGDVEFISRNTVVLVIDPTSGEASLKNQSNFNINIDSYLIQSAPAVLDSGGWTPLETSLGGGSGWRASAGFENRLAEGNLFGSTMLAANGGSLSLGAPIDPALLEDETDLVLEYTVTGLGSIVGGVLFASDTSGVLGDYSGNGIVDAADYTVWRNHLNQAFTLTNENPDSLTPGVVDQEDYKFWKSRFGATAGGGSGGLVGVAAATSAVPEPSAALLACWCGLGVIGGSRIGRDRRSVRDS